MVLHTVKRFSCRFAKHVVQFDKRSITIPLVKVLPRRTHRWEIVREEAPLAASAIFIDQGIDNRAEIDFGWPTTTKGGGDYGLDGGPLCLRQVGRVESRIESALTLCHGVLLPIRKLYILPSYYATGFRITL